MNSLNVVPISVVDGIMRFAEWDNCQVPLALANIVKITYPNVNCMVISASRLPTTDIILTKCDGSEYQTALGKFSFPQQLYNKFEGWPERLFIQMR